MDAISPPNSYPTLQYPLWNNVIASTLSYTKFLYAFVFLLSREPIGVDTGKGMPGAQELCQTLKS